MALQQPFSKVKPFVVIRTDPSCSHPRTRCPRVCEIEHPCARFRKIEPSCSHPRTRCHRVCEIEHMDAQFRKTEPSRSHFNPTLKRVAPAMTMTTTMQPV